MTSMSKDKKVFFRIFFLVSVMMKSFQFLRKTDIVRKFGLSLELTNRGFFVYFELVSTPSPRTKDEIGYLVCGRWGVVLWDFLEKIGKMGFAPQLPLQKFFSFSKTIITFFLLSKNFLNPSQTLFPQNFGPKNY